jgi:hypothetical protein
VHRSVLRVVVLGLAVALAVGVATASGGNSANAKVCQKNGWNTFLTSTGQPFVSEEACVSYGARGGTYAQASLVWAPTISYDCSARGCFGVLTGTGLAPGTEVVEYQGGVIFGVGFADGNGDFGGNGAEVSCGFGLNDVYATATTAGGQPITSNIINSPCG